MKKFLILLFLLILGFGANAYANGYLDALDSVGSVLDVIDRTEYVYGRVKNKVDKAQNVSTKVKNKTSNPKQKSTTIYSPSQKTSTYQEYKESDYNDIPEYSQTQTNIQSGAHRYNQNRVYSDTAKTLKDLPAGVLLIDPTSVWNFREGTNYSGPVSVAHPVFWRKLEDNHFSQGSTLLLSEVIVAKYPFCHSQKGLRDWSESDVRRFLRTSFYTHLSTGFKNAIVPATIPYADMTGNAKTIQDNLFLLSIVEWGLSDRAKNGTVIKYNDIPNIYRTIDFEYNTSTNTYRMYSSGRPSMTRTINRPVAQSAGYTSDVFAVRNTGVLETNWVGGDYAIVRPAVNVKSSTPVQGPFNFVYGYDNKDSLIYYVLKF